MSKNERIGERYPVFEAYGTKHKFLDVDSSLDATVEDRIRSIWPFIVRRVLLFSKTLKPRELSNFDPEDVLVELWIKLAEKDDQWTPDRGKYITFAGIVIGNELHAIRDRARTVHGPRNSSCRMKQYRDEADSGRISGRRAKTANDILRTRDGTFDLSCVSTGSESEPGTPLADGRIEGSVESIANKEASLKKVKEMRTAIRKLLTPFEALVLSLSVGIGPGIKEWSPWPVIQSDRWVSMRLEREECDVRRARERAVKKIRNHFLYLSEAS